MNLCDLPDELLFILLTLLVVLGLTFVFPAPQRTGEPECVRNGGTWIVPYHRPPVCIHGR